MATYVIVFRKPKAIDGEIPMPPETKPVTRPIRKRKSLQDRLRG